MIVYMREPKSTLEVPLKGWYARVPSPESSLRSVRDHVPFEVKSGKQWAKSLSFQVQLKFEIQVRNMLMISRTEGLEGWKGFGSGKWVP